MTVHPICWLTPLFVALLSVATGCNGSTAVVSTDFEVRTAVIDTPEGPREVAYRILDGSAVAEGDILLDGLVSPGPVKQGLAARPYNYRDYRWPGGVVPYIIEGGFPNWHLMQTAIEHWHQATPIRFVPWSGEPDYLVFRPTQNACNCHVGRIGGPTVMHMGATCFTEVGQAVHELGHAVGLWHEQTRSDRDSYVAVHWWNIQPEFAHAFYTYPGYLLHNMGTYDYDSVMHYPSDSYAIDPRYPTLTRHDGGPLPWRDWLSAGDIGGINVFYRDYQAPQVSFSYPNNSIYEQPNRIPPVKAFDPGGVGVQRVEFYLNGVFRGNMSYCAGCNPTAQGGDWYPSPYPVSPGTYTLTARAFDAVGNVATTTTQEYVMEWNVCAYGCSPECPDVCG